MQMMPAGARWLLPLACLACGADLGAQGGEGGQSVARALVEFLVSGPGGARLGDATLDVSRSEGGAWTLLTNANGQALLPDVQPGVLRVKVRRIGFRPGEVAVRVEPGRNTVPILLAAASLPALDTVRVVGDRRINARFDEFETRRLRHEATASLDQADIARRDPLETWHLFRTLPGVRMIRDPVGGGMVPASTRGLAFDGRNGAVPCLFSVYLDGASTGYPFDVRNLPPPGELYGVEVFAGAASVPLRYTATVLNDRTCGVIAIWTK